MTKRRTLKTGDGPDKRAVIDASAPTADPTLIDLEGTQGFDARAADWLHMSVRFHAGATSATVTPWYWSAAAGYWFEGAPLTFTTAANDGFKRVEIRHPQRVFFVLDAAVGGRVQVWAEVSSNVDNNLTPN